MVPLWDGMTYSWNTSRAVALVRLILPFFNFEMTTSLQAWHLHASSYATVCHRLIGFVASLRLNASMMNTRCSSNNWLTKCIPKVFEGCPLAYPRCLVSRWIWLCYSSVFKGTLHPHESTLNLCSLVKMLKLQECCSVSLTKTFE